MRMSDYVTGLQHIGIPTKDLGGSLLFYTELGFDPVYSTENPNNGRTVSFLQQGNLMLEIYEDEEAAQCTGAIEDIALDVNDIEEAYRFALSRGMKCLDDEIRFLPYWEKGIRYFTLEGPNREKVELSQILK